MPAYIDRTNTEHGCLSILNQEGKNIHGMSLWKCKCLLCGEYSIRKIDPRNANKTCGRKCSFFKTYKKETHGHSRRGVYKNGRSKVYGTWQNIKQRCFNPNNDHYNDYGGRGITMHPDWIDDFPAFFTYIGSPPEDIKRWSIDRIDNNGNYEPGNIRWTTMKLQSRNKRTSVMLTYQGETLNLEDWAKKLDLPPPLLSERRTRGCSIEQILAPLHNRYGEKIVYEGVAMTLRELAKKTGIKYGTLWHRRSIGKPLVG